MKFREDRKLASGGFGEVFAGTLTTDDGTVLHADVVAKRLRGPQSRELRERFVLEMRLLRDLRHRHIIEVVDSNASAEPPYFVMPRADGSLRDRIRDGLALAEGLDIFGDVCAGVAHAHANDVIHRDLKPENVLLLDGQVKVSDFGLGKSLDPAVTVFPTAHGQHTPEYSAPEQTGDPESVGTWSDVFALGKMLWELAVGELPVAGCLSDGALDRVGSSGLATLIERCCAEEPSERYRDAGQLEAALRGTTVVVSPSLPPNEQLEKLVEKWYAAPKRGMAQVLRQIHRLLQRHRDDEELYYSHLPQLPGLLLEQYAENIPAGFRPTVECYLRHTAGRLPYSYCDVAAKFCARVFDATEDEALRILVLSRAMEIGATHNRYPVADIVRTLLWSISDANDAAVAVAAISAEPTSRWYDHRLLYERPLHPAVQSAMRRQLAATVAS